MDVLDAAISWFAGKAKKQKKNPKIYIKKYFQNIVEFCVE